MQTVNKAHIIVPMGNWKTIMEYFVQRSIGFSFTPARDVYEQPTLFILTVDFETVPDEHENWVLEFQGYCASYDITPIIQITP